ncbi:hypothetical protein J6T66_03580 [bacterium]|nr:hypothetical protein [bacterium]
MPQLISLDLGSTNFVSLDKFADKETTREDIENMVKYLITDSKIYRKVSSLPNVQDSRWK